MIEIFMLASHISAVERRGSAFVAASSSRPPPLAVRYSGPVLAHSLTICQETTECLLWRLVCPERVLVKQLPSDVNALCGTASMPFPLCMWNYPVVCSRVLVEVRGYGLFLQGPEVNVLRFAGQIVRDTIAQICCCHVEAAIGSMEVHGHGCVHVRFCLRKQATGEAWAGLARGLSAAEPRGGPF